jgi:hypothetical protein
MSHHYGRPTGRREGKVAVIARFHLTLRRSPSVWETPSKEAGPGNGKEVPQPHSGGGCRSLGSADRSNRRDSKGGPVIDLIDQADPNVKLNCSHGK